MHEQKPVGVHINSLLQPSFDDSQHIMHLFQRRQRIAARVNEALHAGGLQLGFVRPGASRQIEVTGPR